jgi:hypothetical protein
MFLTIQGQVPEPPFPARSRNFHWYMVMRYRSFTDNKEAC